MFSRFTDWLIQDMDDWMIELIDVVDSMFDWLIHFECSLDWLIYWFMIWWIESFLILIEWLTDSFLMFIRFSDGLNHLLIHSFIKDMEDWMSESFPVHCFIDWRGWSKVLLTDWLTDWLSRWLIYWFMIWWIYWMTDWFIPYVW